MKKLVFLLLISGQLIGQENNNEVSDFKFCSSHIMEHLFYENHPELQQDIDRDIEELETFTEEFIQNFQFNRSSGDYVIPVVFHVLHDNGAEDISDDQVHDEMRVLNTDFAGRNPDTVDVIAEFKNLIGTANFEFRLARLDPQGNPTTGIIRYETQETYNAGEGVKPGRQWPRESYLNIYVAENIGGAAGYTYTPGSVNGSPTTDAILILHNYVGSIGTGSYNRSRTLTHEVGHWLNLSHTWGGSNDPSLASNCNSDDNVSDTPNTEGWTNCNMQGTTCGSLDNVQNYMEYAYCSRMFTHGQVSRMTSAINSSTADRNELWTTQNLNETGVNQIWEMDFISTVNLVCEGNAVNFEDASSYVQNNWSWTFDGGIPATSTDQFPIVTYDTPGLYTVSFSGDDVNGTQSLTRYNYILVSPLQGKYMPWSEGFESTNIPGGDWLVVNPHDDNSWEISSLGAFTGTSSVKMNNYSNTSNREDELISSRLDLSPMTGATLSFQLAYAQKMSANQDRLSLYLSDDCGETWTIRWNKLGAQLATAPMTGVSFKPDDSTEWAEHNITIPSQFLSDGFHVRFVFESDGGNNLFLDDINIQGSFNQTPIHFLPNDGEDGLASAVTIDWKSVPDVDGYEYQVDTDPNFTSGSTISGNTGYLGPAPDLSDTEADITGLNINTTYYWKVRTHAGGVFSSWSMPWSFIVSPTGVNVDEHFDGSAEMNILPNPVNMQSQIRITLNEPTTINLDLLDVNGRVVLPIAKENYTDGEQLFELDGRSLSEGMYFLRLSYGQQILISKVGIIHR